MKIQKSIPAAAKAAASSSGRWDKVMLLLLLMCVVQFFGVWIYPKYEFGGAGLSNPTKTLGVPFQYSLWLLILISSIFFVRSRGVAPFVAVLRPFFPLFLVGLLAGAFGIDPIGSVRMLILWTFMAFSAVVLGFSLPPERVQRALLVMMAVLLLFSIVWSVALPSYGVQGGEGSRFWRGFFLGKSALGWGAALVLVMASSANRPGYRRLPIFTMLLAVICLWGSGSKGALVAAIAASAYGFCMPRLMRRVTPGFGIAIVIVGVLCAIVFAALALPIILEMLGRDITLTGRTVIWKTYFMSMSDTPWLGQGPGSYTGLSAITSVLAARLDEYGAIATPHSIYLGVLGDAGLFGLVIFLGLMIYVALILPAIKRGQWWMLSGTLGFLILVDGLVETHEIFSPGPGWFLLMLVRAMALQQDKNTPAEEPAQRGQARPLGGVASRNLAPAMRRTGY
jgi:exopolysaccharide production protein ExoQ